MSADDLWHRFRYHPADAAKGALHQNIRDMARDFAEVINELCPEGREKALAITKVEEAMMWANAAIARGVQL